MAYHDVEETAFRFSPIQINDHAGSLWIVAILTAAYACLVALVRNNIKWGSFGVEDMLFNFALPFLLGETAVIFSGLAEGLAKFNSITDESHWAYSGRLFLISEILTVIVLALIKCSVATLVLRVFTVDRGRTWSLCLILIFVVGLWGLGSAIGLAVHCSTATIFKTGINAAQCPHQHTRWLVITALDVTTDIALSLLPGLLVSSLHMPRGVKFEVAFVFALRLPLVALSILHLYALDKYLNSQEPQFAITDALLYQQGMLVWSMLSATVPQMRSFMKAFSIQMGLNVHGNDRTIEASYGEGGIALRTIGRVSTRMVSRKAVVGAEYEELESLRP